MTEVQAFVETCKLYCTKPACSDAAPGWGKDMWAAVTIPSTNPSAVNDGRDWVQIGIRSGNDMGKSHRLMAGYPNWADIAWPHVVWTLMPMPSTRRLSHRRLSGNPSSETCVRCTDKATDHMIDHGLTCATFSWGIDNKCEDSDREWITKGYCQQSCFEAGRGYADCCPPPPSPPAPLAPPASATPNMTTAVSLGANGISRGAIQANRTSPSSARRGLTAPSYEDTCVKCEEREPRSTRPPVSDRPSCFMKRRRITCADWKYGIDAYCAGSKSKVKGQSFDADHCQQTCFYRDCDSSGTFIHNFSAGCCRPPPSPPPPSECVMCDDKAPKSIGKAGGETCGDWRDESRRGVLLLLDKSCSKQKWIEGTSQHGPFCQQSCFDAGCGSADCCPVPSPPSSPPAPPSPPRPPLRSPPSSPVVATSTTVPSTTAEAVGTATIKATRNGYCFTLPPVNNTCDVDGMRTVVQGPCPDSGSGRRLASVSAPASLCDAGPVPPARRGLQVQNYVVLEPGEILNLSAIAEDVQEVRLRGGGEKPFETEGSWELPAGRTLVITAVGDARVTIKVTGELAKVSGTLELRGLHIFREPFDDGCGGCEVGFPPLLDILEGGKVEIVESELRVVVGELAIAVKGALVLREAIIAGAPFDYLSEFASDTVPVTAMELLGSLGARFITGIEHGMRHHHCSFPEVFFEDRCQ